MKIIMIMRFTWRLALIVSTHAVISAAALRVNHSAEPLLHNKCRAGHYKAEDGVCRPCERGLGYTEYDNTEPQCFPCHRCRRADQENVSDCTSIRDTVCQCKSGRFCWPGHACEVCSKCQTCADGHVTLTSCNSTSDAVCGPPPDRDSTGNVKLIVGVVVAFVVFVAFVVIVACYCLRKSIRRVCGRSRIQFRLREFLKNKSVSLGRESQQPERPLGSEGVGGDRGGDEAVDRLLPLNQENPGERLDPQGVIVSLQSQAGAEAEVIQVPEDIDNWLTDPTKGPMTCDKVINEVPTKQWKQLMRRVGLRDNDICQAESHYPNNVREQSYAMLQTWIEWRGRHAKVNQLLKVLCDIHLVNSAEKIREKLIQEKALNPQSQQ